MAKRHQAFEIFAPALGIRADFPTNELPPRAVSTGQDFRIYYGYHQKEYGTSMYATGVGSALGAPINMIQDAKYPTASVLQVLTHANVYRYTAAGDTFVSDGQIFTGTYADFWSSVIHNDAFIYTNGIDPMQIKTSVSVTGTNMASAISPTTYKAWALASLRDHLCLYHTVENGAEHYKRVRWTKKGALVYSAGTTDFDSGTAGAIDLQDAEGAIQTAALLGAGAAVYAERSIHVQFWVGGDEIFRFSKTVPGIGTPSRRGVVSHGDANFLLGHTNVYAYYGGDDLRPIGNSIKRLMFSEINDSAIANSYVEFDDRENEVLFHIPTGTSELPDTTWVYRTQDQSWARLKRNYTAGGRFSRKTGLTIGELQGSIGQQTWKFGDAQISLEASVRLYGDQSGRVVKHDITRYTISESGADVNQNYVFETPDHTGTRAKDPEDGSVAEFVTTEQRWQRLQIEATGSGSAAVLYSTNHGLNFTAFDESPITLVNSGTTHTLDMEAVSPMIRFKVTSTGANDPLAISYYKVEFLPGSDT